MKRLFLSSRIFFKASRPQKRKAPPSLHQIEEAKHVNWIKTLSFELRTTQTRINAPLPHRPFLLSFRPVPLPLG